MAVADVSQKSIAELISLKGRCAVVTGGAQGLGLATVRRLAEAGAAVVIADLNEALAARVATEVAAEHGAQVIGAHLDVAKSTSIAAVADLAVETFGGIDVWVNNAGIYPNQLIMEMAEETWDTVMAVNLRGTFVGAREAARRMIEAKRGGVVVNLVSTAGFGGMAPGVSAYVASKHGVRGLIRQLAIELAPHDIRVLGVAPTFCVTEGNTAALASLPDRVREEIASTLTSKLGRVGVADDIARAILFCASDMAIFMTGSTILVDAGEVA